MNPEDYADRVYQEHRDSRGDDEWTDNLKVARSQASLLDDARADWLRERPPPDDAPHFCRRCDEEITFCVCWERR